MTIDIGSLVDLARDAAHEAFENPDSQRHVEQAMRQRHGDVRVEQSDLVIELEERQREHGGGGHAVGQQPEEQVLVAEELVARERVGRRQSHCDRYDRVHQHVEDRVEEHAPPFRIAEHLGVVVEREGLREQREAAGDLGVGLEAHADEPVDRRQQKQDVDRRNDPSKTALLHGAASGLAESESSRVITA